MKVFTAFFMLLLPFPLFANDWRWYNTILEGAFVVECWIDYQQTMHMAEYNWHQTRSPEFGYYRETNPILGRNPSRAKVLTFGLTCIVLHSAIAYYLPTPYREIWQCVIIGAEGANIDRNRKIGLQYSLAWRQPVF